LEAGGLRLAQPGGPTARVSILPFLPEDRRRSSFRNIVTLLKYRQWTKSRKPLSHKYYFKKVHSSKLKKIVESSLKNTVISLNYIK
jgi:hypothetical protein